MGIDFNQAIRPNIFRSTCIATLLTCLALLPAAAAQVGEVEFARGAVTLDGRDISRGDEIEPGQTVVTGGNGIAVLRLEDNSRMTLRPNSEFSIQQLDNSDQPSALLNLLRGGLRLVTGLIGKINPMGYRVQTPTATIGIRGTEFSARICADDCAADEAGLAEVDAPVVQAPVARMAFSHGLVVAISEAGIERTLIRNGPLFEGDRIQTTSDSWAVLVFRDDSRISLNPDTVFDIAEMSFDVERPQRNSAFFRLVRGGLRALTGLIGDLNPGAFKVATPTATIGIRGTGFDLQCRGACVAPGGDLGAAVDAVSGEGLYASTWNGIIDVELDDRSFALRQGESAFFANGATAPVVLEQVPGLLQNLLAPRPDKLQVPNLFDAVSPKDVGEGLYVNVDDGQVLVENQAGELALGPGEAGYVSDIASLPLRLSAVPKFQALDAVPSPGSFAPGEIELPDDLLDGIDAAAGAALGAAALIVAIPDEDEPLEPEAVEQVEAAAKEPVAKAADGVGFYFGAAGGFARPDAEEEAIEADLGVINGASVDVTGFDNSSAGRTSKFFVGYRFGRFLGVELGRYDLGNTDHSTVDAITDVDATLERIPFPITGTAATGSFSIPIGFPTKNTSIFARGGVILWEGESELDVNGTKFSKSFSGESSIIGAGVNLALGETFSLRVEVERIDMDPEALMIGTAGVVIRF